MIYVLAYPAFAPHIADRINAFRTQHEPKRAKLVPPHITLVFGVADAYLQIVSDLLDVATGQVNAFPVGFGSSIIEFDSFEKKHKLFLLCDEGRERIAVLQAAL